MEETKSGGNTAMARPQNLAGMYENMNAMMKKLKKPTYEKNYQQFREKNGTLIGQIAAYVEQSDDKKKAGCEIGRQLVQEVRETFASPKGKMNSGVQADLNLFTIFYIFPALLMEEGGDGRLIADCICKEWAKEFKGNNISYTDYDTLYESFRNKIFGLF